MAFCISSMTELILISSPQATFFHQKGADLFNQINLPPFFYLAAKTLLLMLENLASTTHVGCVLGFLVCSQLSPWTKASPSSFFAFQLDRLGVK
ncbi:hypothetical protein EMIT0P2_10935 [Pseudomonas sp. IT-P2]